MQVDLETVLRGGGVLEAALPESSLPWERGEEIDVSGTTLSARLERLARGIEMTARLSTYLRIECVRCLEPFDLPISWPFRLLFVRRERAPGHAESQVAREECDHYPCEDGKVDLSQLAREQIYLQIPLKPICRPSCSGLCTACGANLNPGPCGCSASSSVRVVQP